MAEALSFPLGYLECDDARLAEIMLAASELPEDGQETLRQSLRQSLEQLQSAQRK